MRILSLDLERYGPFTGKTIDFQSDAKLHIVYGRNEAGKSCSLAAITDLFFGIEARTRYDFLHEGKELRVGATIETQSGSRLTFRRRKGNKNTLLDSAGSSLNDNVLLPFLGNLSREVFCHAFGLNTEKLREGAEEMLKSEGEVGASLFAAASGLRGLTDLRRNMEAEADDIFAPRVARERIFYQALDRFETARKAIRELELKAGDLKARNDRIEELTEALKQIKDERRQKAIEHARLSRLKRVAPLLRLIDTDIETLSLLGDLPEVAVSFTDHLREGLDVLAKATDASKSAGAEYEQTVLDLADIIVDEALLAKAGDVQRLFGETAAYANDRRDIPRIQTEADEYSAQLSQLAVRLGLPNSAVVENQQPTDASLALTRSLIAEGKTLDSALKSNKRSIASEIDALAETEQRRTDSGGFVDPRPLREMFATFGPVLKQLDKRSELERTLTVESRSLNQAAARLEPPIPDLGSISLNILPTLQAIGRFRQQFDDLAEGTRRAKEQAEASADVSAKIETNLHEFTSGRPMPSADAIATERNERDQAWTKLRGGLIGTTDELSGATLTDTILTFEQHSTAADRLADLAVTDAERVATYTAENRTLREEQRKGADAKARLNSQKLEQDQLMEAWRAAWSSAALTPLPPAEMAVWLTATIALLERGEKRDTIKEEIERIDAAISTIVPALQALADKIVQPHINGLDASLLAQSIENHLSRITASWDEARDIETSVRNIQVRLDKLRIAETDVTRQFEAWKTRWREVVTKVELAPTASMDEAEATIEAWKDVPGLVRELNNRTRRVVGMQRNVDGFETQAKTLVEALAPDLLLLPREMAVKALADRLTAARSAEARRDQTLRRLTEVTQARDAAHTKMEEADAAISTLSEAIPKEFNLSDLLVRLVQQNQVVGSLTERRSQLVAQGDGFSEDQLRAELASFNADRVEAAVRELTTEDDDLDRRSQEVFAERDRGVHERQALEQGVGAEVALQQRRNAEAELADAARAWTVLKFGALLIGRVIDQYRASRQDPLMARAGKLFTTLTGGAFKGLSQDFDENDTPHLVGQRSSGELVSVAGLSEGTRDQLYLALRLAYLEDFSGRTEAVPFIGDDLFTSFDEDRTANGLAALAAIGDRMQSILFTHHRYVVEIARRTMGSDVAIIELD